MSNVCTDPQIKLKENKLQGSKLSNKTFIEDATVDTKQEIKNLKLSVVTEKTCNYSYEDNNNIKGDEQHVTFQYNVVSRSMPKNVENSEKANYTTQAFEKENKNDYIQKENIKFDSVLMPKRVKSNVNKKTHEHVFDKNSSDSDSEGDNYNFEIKSTFDNTNLKLLLDTSDKDEQKIKSYSNLNHYDNELETCITSIAKRSSKITIQNMQLDKLASGQTLSTQWSEDDFTNTEEILDFNQYNKECLEQIKKIKYVPDSFIEKYQVSYKLDKTKYKKLVIFDLDETLAHCEKSDLNLTEHIVNINLPSGKTTKVGINIRPYVYECLKQIKEESKYDIICYTASISQYANAVLNIIDKNNDIFDIDNI